MRFINSPKTIFGLDISDLSIKAVQIGQNGGKKYIRAINSLPVPLGCISEGIIRENEQVAEIVKQLINDGARKFSTKYAALSLPETKTFIKVLEISDQEMAVEEAIRQELPRHVPIGAEEMQIDWQPVEHDLQKKKFLVGAVPKSIADEYVKVAKLAGVEAVALEIEAQAIARCILPWGKKNRDRGGLSGLFKKNAKTEKDRALVLVAKNDRGSRGHQDQFDFHGQWRDSIYRQLIGNFRTKNHGKNSPGTQIDNGRGGESQGYLRH